MAPQRRWLEGGRRWLDRPPACSTCRRHIFDGVVAHGDRSLGDAVWTFAQNRAQHAPDFIKMLSVAAADWRPPLTVFGNIRIDENGRTDLKKAGLMPILIVGRCWARSAMACASVRRRTGYAVSRLWASADRGGRRVSLRRIGSFSARSCRSNCRIMHRVYRCRLVPDQAAGQAAARRRHCARRSTPRRPLSPCWAKIRFR